MACLSRHLPWVEVSLLNSDVEKKLLRGVVHTMQLNIGIYCNQACSHCHVESSPRRKEMMDRETAERCMALLQNSPHVKVVDITGESGLSFLFCLVPLNVTVDKSHCVF